MSDFFKIGKSISLVCLSTLFTFANPSVPDEQYALKSGVIHYRISGGGMLAPELNLTISGEGSFRFREWGVVSLTEEETQERTSGAFRYSETFTRCVKHNRGRELNVDYTREIILERALPKGENREDPTAGMTRHGETEIAGRRCALWAKEGKRICLYKGIPLLIERDFLGITYEKKALSLREDSNVSTEQCSVPDFPVQKIALFRTSIKQKKGVKKITQRLMEMVDEVSLKKSLQVNRHKQYYLNKLGENIFQREKMYLPEILVHMKRLRECLQLAGDPLDANACSETYNAQMPETAQEDEMLIGTWSNTEKRSVMDRLDEKIVRLESKMHCIRAAKHLDDLSRCMSR